VSRLTRRVDRGWSRLALASCAIAVPAIWIVHSRSIPPSYATLARVEQATSLLAYKEAGTVREYSRGSGDGMPVEMFANALTSGVEAVQASARAFLPDPEVEVALNRCSQAADVWYEWFRVGRAEDSRNPPGLVATAAARATMDACLQVHAGRQTISDRWSVVRALLVLGFLGTTGVAFVRAYRAERLLVRKLRHSYDAIEVLRETHGVETAEVEQRSVDASRAEMAATLSRDKLVAHIAQHLIRPSVTVTEAARMLSTTQAGDDRRSELARWIHRSAAEMADTIASLMDIDRIRSGELESVVVNQRTSLPEIMDSVRLAVENRALAKSLAFRIEYRGAVPELIETDPDRLRRVLKALLLLAVDTTEDGRVEVVVMRLTREGESGQLQFAVRDNGFGVGAKRMAELLRPQESGETPHSRADLALHPGLSSVAAIVAALGGKLDVESPEGKGSTFVFAIDCGEVEGQIGGTQADGGGQDGEERRRAVLYGRRVLIADDSAANRRLMRYILRDTGADVVTVENGLQAVREAVAAEVRGEPFDVVLMDMQMPVMDGYEAVRLLREQGFERRIVALTAAGSAGDREHCLAQGCDEFMSKPIEKSAFLKMLVQMTGPGESTPKGMALESPLEQLHVEKDHEEKDQELAPEAPERKTTMHEDTMDGTDPIVSDFADDEDMIDLIEWFAADLKHDITRVEQAFEDGDTEVLKTITHQLKGSAGSYGFPTITQQAGRLESCMREGASREDLEREVREFVRMCRRVK